MNMKEIINNLFIGNDADCLNIGNDKDYAIIHACKTCHQKGVGYRGNLSSNHPHYLILEHSNHLYLNMVDMDRELMAKFTHPIMKSALNFIKTHIEGKKVLIHCNQGQSRSPSIGLVYLAQNGFIKNSTYLKAKEEYLELYPSYFPGKGIELYLNNNWEWVLKL